MTRPLTAPRSDAPTTNNNLPIPLPMITRQQLPTPSDATVSQSAASANLRTAHASAIAAIPQPDFSKYLHATLVTSGDDASGAAPKKSPLQRWMTHRDGGQNRKLAADKNHSSTGVANPSTGHDLGKNEQTVDNSDKDKVKTTTVTSNLTPDHGEKSEIISISEDDRGNAGESGTEDGSYEVSSASTSYSESTDEEFGKKDNPRIAPKTREDLEALIFENKDYTTLQAKRTWKKAAEREDREVRTRRLNKYMRDLAAGGVNQLTSFAIGGAVVTATGNPWYFGPVSAVCSELFGERFAQLIRRSTVITTATTQHLENQRRMSRALGDLMETCSGKGAAKKFTVIRKDEDGKDVKLKMTALEALSDAGAKNILGAFGRNLMVRGLPFFWFEAIYTARDSYTQLLCHDTFYPTSANTTLGLHSNPPHVDLSGVVCPDPGTTNIDALRWALVIVSGMLAGGATQITNQIVASHMESREITNYSSDTWKLKQKYLELARLDTREFLNKMADKSYLAKLQSEGIDDKGIEDLIKAATALQGVQDKELAFAEKKATSWTTYQAELDQATQKHRDETVISPEFGGKRLETFLSLLGKLLSLFMYSYFLSLYDIRKAETDQERLNAAVLVPMALIFIGYIWRDDARLVGHLPYGAVKGLMRRFRGVTEDEAEATVATHLQGMNVEDVTDLRTENRDAIDDEEFHDANDGLLDGDAGDKGDTADVHDKITKSRRVQVDSKNVIIDGSSPAEDDEKAVRDYVANYKPGQNEDDDDPADKLRKKARDDDSEIV